MADSVSGERTDLRALVTEAHNASAVDLDLRSTTELVTLMNEEDAGVAAAVAEATEAIAAAVDGIAARLAGGGRLVYVGAGTSGRLAYVDAAECESTFSTGPDLVVALIAGGAGASPVEQEAAEDDRPGGASALADLGVTRRDAVVGVTASGRTPYVLGALEEARDAGALVISIVCAPGSPSTDLVDHEIVVVVGPEVIAGSTRLKAGTAQKLVLNMISTISMIRLGKTYGNLMVDVYASNEKLRARVRSIVETATGATGDAVDDALERADGDAKVAIVALALEVDVEEARGRLVAAGGVVRKALAG